MHQIFIVYDDYGSLIRMAISRALFCLAVCSMYIPAVYVLNKIDTITIQELDLLSKVPHYVPVCADKEWNFDDLLEKIWSYLNMFRMYARSLLVGLFYFRFRET